MKQHITTEQFKSLDLATQSALTGFEVDPDVIAYDFWSQNEFNIGKLIERIQNVTGYPIKIYPKDARVERPLDNQSYYIVKSNLSAFLTEQEREDEGYIAVAKGYELCDALWSALLRVISMSMAKNSLS